MVKVTEHNSQTTIVLSNAEYDMLGHMLRQYAKIVESELIPDRLRGRLHSLAKEIAPNPEETVDRRIA